MNRTQLASAVFVGCSWRSPVIYPPDTIDATTLQAYAFMYAGIQAGSPTPPALIRRIPSIPIMSAIATLNQ